MPITSLLEFAISSAKSRSATQGEAAARLRNDSPLTVRFHIGKNKFSVHDKNNKIPCRFSKKALFWFKMNNENKDLKDIDDEYIVLNEYSLHTELKKNKIDIVITIYQFHVLDKKESKNLKYDFKKATSLVSADELEPYLKFFTESQIKKDLFKQPTELDDLENILAGKKVAKPAKVVSSGKEKEKDILEFGKVNSAENAMSVDVNVLLEEDKKSKGKIMAGSEGNLERDRRLTKVLDKLKDKGIIEILKEHGTVQRPRDAAKSPVKRGKMPKDMQEMIASITGAGKRSKPEGKRSSSVKGKKKAAVVTGGRKLAVGKKRSLRPKSRKA